MKIRIRRRWFQRWFRRIWVPLGLILVFTALVLLVVRAPDLFSWLGADPAAETDQTGSQRQVLLLLFGGILAAVTALLSWKRHEREQQALQIERDRHWTSRYTEAVTQLGSDSETISYGGVYALERLALEAKTASDTQMVVNVLCAYARQHNAPTLLGPGAMGETEGRAAAQAATESVLRVASRHTVTCRLEGAHLSGMDLSELNLQGAKLVGADLRNVNLRDGSLRNADLTDANLRGAYLENTDTVGAVLNGTKMRDATEWSAFKFSHAKLWNLDTEWPEGHTQHPPVMPPPEYDQADS